MAKINRKEGREGRRKRGRGGRKKKGRKIYNLNPEKQRF